MESPLSPSANFAAPPQATTELTDYHKKTSRSCMICMVIVSRILLLIVLLVLLENFDHLGNNNLLVLIRSIFSCVHLLCLLFLSITAYYDSETKLVHDIKESRSCGQLMICRLEGEEWLRYLNYIYGPDRRWEELGQGTSFCCRRSCYNRLSNRRYGHIILFRTGFIIDEMFLIVFELFSLEAIELLLLDPETRGLRFHTRLQVEKQGKNIYFDVFAPSSVSIIQLQTIVQSYSAKITVAESRIVPTIV